MMIIKKACAYSGNEAVQGRDHIYQIGPQINTVSFKFTLLL